MRTGFARGECNLQTSFPTGLQIRCMVLVEKAVLQSVLKDDASDQHQNCSSISQAAFSDCRDKTLTFRQKLPLNELDDSTAILSTPPQKVEKVRLEKLRLCLKKLQEVPIDVPSLNREDQAPGEAGTTTPRAFTCNDAAARRDILLGTFHVRFTTSLADLVTDETDNSLEFGQLFFAGRCGNSRAEVVDEDYFAIRFSHLFFQSSHAI